MKFGEETFGGKDALIQDDDGNPLVLKPCGRLPRVSITPGEYTLGCVGQHIWTDAAGVRCYCAGPVDA